MKNLAAPLGLAGVRSHSKTDRSCNQFFDWPLVRSIVESHGVSSWPKMSMKARGFPFVFRSQQKMKEGRSLEQSQQACLRSGR